MNFTKIVNLILKRIFLVSYFQKNVFDTHYMIISISSQYS